MMFQSISIDGYRCFEHFTISDLGRVNLFVGTNNCGKTTVLEAIRLLFAKGHPSCLFQSMLRRSEYPLGAERKRGEREELDVSHLFHGHVADWESSFEIGGHAAKSGKTTLTCTIVELTEDQDSLFEVAEDDGGPAGIGLQINYGGESFVLPLTRRFGLRSDIALRRFPRRRSDDTPTPEFIGPESASVLDLKTSWGKVALRPEEGQVIEALRAIDSSIVDLTFVGVDRVGPFSARGGFIVKYAGSKQPIPIGSMGDGIWRMLSLVLCAIRAEGSALLVDEIDTGLHYTVMSDMWKMIRHIADRLNVQIFATTHSSDCWSSLAEICRKDVKDRSEVSIQRIEQGQNAAVPFTEEEIVIAAEREIEIR